ncbi:MAG: redoxin domain-containing protein [Nitrospira sp.]|nr:redoxin domain-containing protein [Nitrospira sp.]MDH4343144.1 redoxin domain-containing protein [Nitrospira sp.]MDH5335587.1 redoxin domain-containing protein [Nitrospira sp.]
MNGMQEFRMLRQTCVSLRWLGIVVVVLLVGWLTLRPADAMIGKPAPDITNPTWLNSAPLRMADLRGKVVMVEFWTFGCYNCRNVEPYVKEWYRHYADQGLVVIGVDSPEFSHEREIGNVKQYMAEHDIRFPVPIDNDFSTWNRYGNRYWPAMYLIDKRGIIRYVKIGEGGYGETERQIQSLLAEG